MPLGIWETEGVRSRNSTTCRLNPNQISFSSSYFSLSLIVFMFGEGKARPSPNCNPGLREKNYTFEIIFKSIKKGWKRWNFSYFLCLLSHRHSLRIIFPIYFSFFSQLLSYSVPCLHSHSTLLQCSKGKPIFFLYFL